MFLNLLHADIYTLLLFLTKQKWGHYMGPAVLFSFKKKIVTTLYAVVNRPTSFSKIEESIVGVCLLTQFFLLPYVFSVFHGSEYCYTD